MTYVSYLLHRYNWCHVIGQHQIKLLKQVCYIILVWCNLLYIFHFLYQGWPTCLRLRSTRKFLANSRSTVRW